MRSAVSRSRTGPRTVASTSPGATVAPSIEPNSIRTRPCPTLSNTHAATGSPATTPAALGTRSARPIGSPAPWPAWSRRLRRRCPRPAREKPRRRPAMAQASRTQRSRAPKGQPTSWRRSTGHGSDHGTTSVTNRCRTIPSGSRRTSKCPAHRTSSRFGKSSRQCDPRVSSRARAGGGQRRRHGEQVAGFPTLSGAGGHGAGG